MTLIKEWIDALKSGKYGQATSTLKEEDSNAYCCLGVLVDVHPDFTFDYEIEQSDSDYGYEEYRDFLVFGPTGTYDMEYAPAPIANVTGLNGPVPEWLHRRLGPGHGPVDSIQHALASLNDQGKGFEEIAEVIERLYTEGNLTDPT